VTICVAALASNGRIIVCIADKALSFGDQIQWDADSSKITTLDNNKSQILMAGSESPINRVLRKLDPLTEEWSGDRNILMSLLEHKYKEAFAEEQEIDLLHPQMMNRAEYLAIIASGEVNRHVEQLADRIQNYKFDCALIICGFDRLATPYIILLEPPGKATDCTATGFAAIGTGAEKSISSLLFGDYARSHGVAHALYECMDAKLRSEIAPGVGYEWEMRLVTSRKAVPLVADAKPLLEKVWSKHNRSPFEKREKDDLPNPPKDWKDRLKRFVVDSLQELRIEDIRALDD